MLEPISPMSKKLKQVENPVTSGQVYKYIMVLQDSDINTILAEPLISRAESDPPQALTALYKHMTDHGLQLHLHMIDNGL